MLTFDDETRPKSSSAATGGGGRKGGKAPRVGEVKKWLAALVDGVGGMEEKLAAATMAMSAAGQQGHGGVRQNIRCIDGPHARCFVEC